MSRAPAGGREEGRDGGRDTVLARLRREGLVPRKDLGQHFLHDPRLLGEIAAAAALGPLDAVLEVGTGPATLTRHLAAQAGRVLTVEVEPGMAEFARRELADAGNVTVLCLDALDGKGGLNPLLIESLEAVGPFKLVANLPYSAATPILLSLAESRLPWELAVVTIQKELAERLRAGPGRREYSPATALIAYWARVERVRKLPAGAFWPPPEVVSEVVRLRPRPSPLGPREVFPAYRAWVHALLSQRRKQVGGLLREVLGNETAREALLALGLEPSARPDAIPPEGFLLLAVRAPCPDGSSGNSV